MTNHRRFNYARSMFRERQATYWTDHWTHGGTGVSKLTPGENTTLQVLESVEKFNDPTLQVLESVEKFNDPTVYIHNGELHSSRKPLDLSDFWKFHRELHGIKLP